MAVIDRIGRYSHRNAILERSASAQQLAFFARAEVFVSGSAGPQALHSDAPTAN